MKILKSAINNLMNIQSCTDIPQTEVGKQRYYGKRYVKFVMLTNHVHFPEGYIGDYV